MFLLTGLFVDMIWRIMGLGDTRPKWSGHMATARTSNSFVLDYVHICAVCRSEGSLVSFQTLPVIQLSLVFLITHLI